jgi:hypothetical protein
MDDHACHATTSQDDRWTSPSNDHVPATISKDDPSIHLFHQVLFRQPNVLYVLVFHC